MPIDYVAGDLFANEYGAHALAHGCNCQGSMGAGIAVEFRRRWPAMYDAYRSECRSGRLQPGGIFVYQAADRLIVNLATQRGVGRGAARLKWVRQATRAAAQLSVAGLALPRIGAGAWAGCAGLTCGPSSTRSSPRWPTSSSGRCRTIQAPDLGHPWFLVGALDGRARNRK